MNNSTVLTAKPVKKKPVVIASAAFLAMGSLIFGVTFGADTMNISDVGIGWIGIVGLVILMLMKVPVGVALGVVAIAGVYVLIGASSVWSLLSTVPYDFAAHWTLSSIPMFLLMGYVLYHANLTEGLFRVARLWLSALPGGLAIASIGGSAGFSAVTGSSLACASAMGRIAVPEMLRHGYDKGLATGVAAAGGTIGVMIPPSLLLLIYGIYAEVPIGKLFIAGLIPGLLTAFMFSLMVIIRVKLKPSLAPKLVEEVTWGQRFAALVDTWPVILLITLVVGGLLGGVFTPTEAGAVGALVSIIIAKVKGAFSFKQLLDSVQETLTSTASIFVIVIGAALFTKFLALTGVPEEISSFFVDSGASVLGILLGIAVVYLIMGMFLDNIGIMLITLPMFLPVLEASNIDLIWFGILLCKFLEVALVTPPVGLNCFVIKGVVGKQVATSTIFAGVSWFILADFVTMALLLLFPDISLFLPGLLD